MKVIYDISPIKYRPEYRTGIARVALSTATHLNKLLSQGELTLSATGSLFAASELEQFIKEHDEFLFANSPLNFFDKKLLKFHSQFQSKKGALLLGIMVNILRFRNLVRHPINRNTLKGADIFHSSYARIPNQVRDKLPNRHVLTVHDLTPLRIEKKFVSTNQISITKRIIDSIRPGDHVITISNSTRNDLLNYNDKLNPTDVTVIYNAADESIFYPASPENIALVRKKLNLTQKQYFLSLHSMAPHKNINTLIEAFMKFVTEAGKSDYALVLSGGHGRDIDSLKSQIGLTTQQQKFIHLVGYTDDKELAGLYSGAEAFVFPSLYEGFGLPVLEAMQCGCPVIASKTSSIPEITNGAGILIDPTSSDEIADALSQIASNSELKDDLQKRGISRASFFNWNNNANETVSLYKNINEWQ